MRLKPKVLITDGEGPLVFKDLARDVAAKMQLEYNGQIVDGSFLFDTLSLYNAYLAESGNHPNQPGDTLALLVPHLLAHGITDEDLQEESKNTQLANGVEAYLRSLNEDGWQIRVISTAYSALWDHVGPRLGIPKEHILSSYLSLWQLVKLGYWSEDLKPFVQEAERSITSQHEGIREAQQDFRNGLSLEEIFTRPAMAAVTMALDQLHNSELKRLGFSPYDEEKLLVVGGTRKISALAWFMRELPVKFADLAYVGDSITDDAVHRFLKEKGGLSIAVNSDYYGLRNAVVAVATEDMMANKPLLEAWESGGLGQVEAFVEAKRSIPFGKERIFGVEKEASARYDLVPADEEAKRKLARVHQEYRSRIRKTPLAIL